MMNQTTAFYEIAIVGEDWNRQREEFGPIVTQQDVVGSPGESDLPLEMKYVGVIPESTYVRISLVSFPSRK